MQICIKKQFHFPNSYGWQMFNEIQIGENRIGITGK